MLIDRGIAITSCDEEHGLLKPDYEDFANARFSEETVAQATEIYCWGPKDYDFLIGRFPQHKSKFVDSGSPRVDVWKEAGARGNIESKLLTRPLVLFSSNFGINSRVPYWKEIRSKRRAGYLDRVEAGREKFLLLRSENLRVLAFAVDMLEEVAKAFPGVDFIVRPHPVETESAWRALIEETPNLKVKKSGFLSDVIAQASVLIHNGCTSALEATVAGLPVISYVPGESLTQDVAEANLLGLSATNTAEVIGNLARLLGEEPGEKNENDPTIQRLLFMPPTLSSERIVSNWTVLSQASEHGVCDPDYNRLGLLGSRLSVWKATATLRFDRDEAARRTKFPPLRLEELERLSKQFSDYLGVRTPRVRLLGRRVAVFLGGQ